MMKIPRVLKPTVDQATEWRDRLTENRMEVLFFYVGRRAGVDAEEVKSALRSAGLDHPKVVFWNPETEEYPYNHLLAKRGVGWIFGHRTDHPEQLFGRTFSEEPRKITWSYLGDDDPRELVLADYYNETNQTKEVEEIITQLVERRDVRVLSMVMDGLGFDWEKTLKLLELEKYPYLQESLKEVREARERNRH